MNFCTSKTMFMYYFWVFLEKFGAAAINIVSIMLLARMLTPEDFGLYAMVGVVVSVSLMLVDSGMGASIIRKGSVKTVDYSTVYLYSIFLGLLIYVVIYVSAPLVADFYEREELALVVRVLGIVVIIRSLAIVQSTKLTKELKFKSQAFAILGCKTLSMGVAVILAKFGLGYWALVGQNFADAIFFTVSMMALSKYVPSPKFSKEIFYEHFSFGIKILAASLIDIGSKNIIVVVAGKKFGAITTGFYYQANKLNEVFNYLSKAVIDKAALPLLAQRKENIDEFHNYSRKLLKGACYVCFFVVSLLIALPYHVIFVLLGKQWVESAWILQIIAISGYGLTVETVCRVIFKALGHSSIVLKLSLLKGSICLLVLGGLSVLGLREMLLGWVVISIIHAFINMWVVGAVTNYNILNQVKDVFIYLCISIAFIAFLEVSLRMTGAINSFTFPIIVVFLLSPLCYLIIGFFFRAKESMLCKQYMSGFLKQGYPRV